MQSMEFWDITSVMIQFHNRYQTQGSPKVVFDERFRIEPVVNYPPVFYFILFYFIYFIIAQDPDDIDSVLLKMNAPEISLSATNGAEPRSMVSPQNVSAIAPTPD